MKRLVIIPAYNEAGSILNTVRDIMINAPTFDYVVINDCSRDNTREILEKHHINHVNLTINSGIGAAVQTGYIYAEKYGYDTVIQVDGDGQHDASFLEVMADRLENDDVQMVIGSRFINGEGFQSTGLRRIGIKYFTRLIKRLTGHTITDPTSGLRMVNGDIVKLFAKEYPKDYPEPETAVAILKRGFKIEEIPVVMKERASGKSSISFGKAVYYMVKVPLACMMAAWGESL